MKNTLGVGQNKKNKLSWRIILGVIVSLLFCISVDVILWSVEVLSTTISVIPVVILNFVLTFSVGAILRVIELWRNNSKMKNTLLKCLELLLLVIGLFFVIFKFGWMIICFHYFFLFLLATIIYYTRNLVMEYREHSCPLEGDKRKERKITDILISILFLIVIGMELVFIVKQMYLIISSGEMIVAIQKIVWAAILLSVVIGGHIYRKRERSILQNIHIASWAVFLVYIIFTYNQMGVRCNDLIFADDFSQESSDRNREYDEVFRFQSEGLLGSINQIVYTGREQEIRQEFEFQYTIYRVKNKWVLNQIKSQYISIPEEARVTNVRDAVVYEVKCNRKKYEYEIGTTYYLSKAEEYDYLIMIEDEERILEFYYRDFKDLSQEEILNIVVDKFLGEK